MSVDPHNLTPGQVAAFRKSDWYWKKKFIWLRARGKCELCGQRRGRDVHHKTYERVDEELPDDLVLLCDCCHDAIHGVWFGWRVMGSREICNGYWPVSEVDLEKVLRESARRARLLASEQRQEEIAEASAKRDARWGSSYLLGRSSGS